jgi:formylglycine-generating enzyme required for sulfatase activity
VSESPFVFISFASGDAELAHRAVDTLERAGIRCWIADRDIQMAASYPAAITAAIKASGALLLLLTEGANGSPHVLREVELAFTDRRPILPVRIAGVQPSADLQYFLSTSQWLDAGRAFDDSDLTRIEPVLRELLAHGRQSRPFVDPASHLVRMVAVTLLVVTVAVAALIWFRHRPEAPSPATSNTRSTRPSSPAPQPAPSPPSPTPDASPNARATAPPAGAAPASRLRTRTNARDGQTYVWIAPGRFAMGCSEGDPACGSDEQPVHEVEIARGFWLATSEVTAAQYRKAKEDGARPAAAVSWAAAKAYCAAAGGRLPTEAEWEYAARAGSRSRYYGQLDAIAWYQANSDDQPHPVARKTPNAFGLYDMLGNVSEWVLDRYYNAYDETSDPQKPDQPLAGNASAVARGGSWVSDARGIRVSRRLEMPPDAEEPHIGFRCAADRLPS